MDRKQSHQAMGLCLLAMTLASEAAPSRSAASPDDFVDVFVQFTQHIHRQTDADKKAFSKASQCMNWFYRQERQKPVPPPVQGIAWRNGERGAANPVQSQSDCDRRYPGGLDAVRQDFQQTQTSLSVSLTFYEFALVGDKDDNHTYSAGELKDILRALELPVEYGQGRSGQLKSLTRRFDSIHRASSMETLMKSMSLLYEQGYRFTAADKANLDGIMK